MTELYVLWDRDEPSTEYEHDVKSREEISSDEAIRRNRVLIENGSLLRWIPYSQYEKQW